MMRMGPRYALIAFSLAAVASPLLGQGTPKKKGPTVQDLQAQIIDLQGQLLECQKPTKANAPNPMREALEAFQTFNSTVDTGLNQAAYKAALVPLKIKVDKLPDNEQTAPMKKTLDMLVDAGSLWNTSLTRNEKLDGLVIPGIYVDAFIDKYKEEWQPIKAAGMQYSPQHGGCYNDGVDIVVICVRMLYTALISEGQENIKAGFKPEVGAKVSQGATEKPCTPRYYRNGLDNPCPEPASASSAGSGHYATLPKPLCLIDGKFQECPPEKGK